MRPLVVASRMSPGSGVVPKVGDALLNLAGCSRRDALISLVMLAFICAMFGQARLVMFGVFLLSCMCHCAALLSIRFLWPSEGWAPAWSSLGFSLIFSSMLLWWPYRAWGTGVGQFSLLPLQFFTALIGFGLLVVGLPLWNAQRLARALQLGDLKQAALASELKALQAQVEPHFLFNTLANIRYLARQNPERAVQMLDHLIAYLHSALPDMRRAQSTLGRECELAAHYLALMQIRFGERLRFHVHCAPDIAWQPVPPLMLMTLVENAIKHGVEPKPGAVEVQVIAQLDGKHLSIAVSDNGAGLQDSVMGSGLGLRNVRERLGALYGDNAGFELRQNPAGQTEAAIFLPAATLEELNE